LENFIRFGPAYVGFPIFSLDNPSAPESREIQGERKALHPLFEDSGLCAPRHRAELPWLSAYIVFSSVTARFFTPQVSGIGAVPGGSSVFRIDGLCPASQYGSTFLAIPAAGTENDDHNPPRIASRNLFDVSPGRRQPLSWREEKVERARDGE
jgi:hypothetical protein